jgi:hypothetical protein
VQAGGLLDNLGGRRVEFHLLYERFLGHVNDMEGYLCADHTQLGLSGVVF